MKSLERTLALSLFALTLTACGDGALEIVGTYTTNFSTEETITETHWNDAEIIDFDNDAQWAVTQNPADAEYFPSMFSRSVWTAPEDDGSFFYCTVDFGVETFEAAKTSTRTADATDPANGGCGGFSWTGMTPK